jgi:hypothetical protein
MKSHVLFCFVLLTSLLSCTENEINVSPNLTVDKLANVIAKTNDWHKYNALQIEINANMAAIIHNAKPEFIRKYKVLRNKYTSFPELVTTANTDDKAKFNLFWNELMSPIQLQLKERDRLLTAIYNDLTSRLTFNQRDFYRAVWKLNNAKSNLSKPNAKLAQTCEEYGRDMGYKYGVYYLGQGYSYEYAMGAAQIISVYYTDLCYSGEVGVWA